MLISCKCLNFVGGSSTSRSPSCGNIHQFDKSSQLNINRSSYGVGLGAELKTGTAGEENRSNDVLITELMNDFLQKYARNSIFYSQCLDLFKQAIGPLADLSVNIQQRDLICTLPCSSWVLNICINCNTALCAKHTSDAIYLINSNLLTSHEELIQRKVDKSFSETFGIQIMNHQLKSIDDSSFHVQNSPSNNRLRSLTQNLQSRLRKEIADTDERIVRYTEQQFALLKSFREKSEQEYQILVSLVKQVPDQIFDAMGSAGSNPASAPTTPTTLTKIVIGGGSDLTSNTSSAGAMDSSNTQVSAQSVFSFNNKKVTSFDTPPATPDSTPMSVGNSPTFNRQQQTGIAGMGAVSGGHRSSLGSGMFFINSANSNGGAVGGLDGDGDCLFELEGVENYSVAPRTSIPLNMSDVEESAEDAEDALAELEAAIPIPGKQSVKDMSNFAKSLPIAIANSVNESSIIADSDDDILDDNVDIAASIKALAKSVHGDAVFGDLPRPRLRTQI